MIVARYKHGPRNYLATPMYNGPELWWWSPDIKNAHVFPSRAEAKAMLRSLRPGPSYYKLTDFTFEKAPPL